MGFLDMPAIPSPATITDTTGNTTTNYPILSSEWLNIIRANTEYIYSLEAYAAPMCRQVRCWSENITDRICATWYFRHWAQYLELTASIGTVVGGVGSFKIQIDTSRVDTGWVDAYNSGALTAGTTVTISPAVDLTAGSFAGLVKGVVYPLRLVATNCTLTVNRIYTRGGLPLSKGGYDWYTHVAGFTGSTSFVPTAADFNGWINNLNYLRDQLGGTWAPCREYTSKYVGPTGYAVRYDFQHRGTSASFAYQCGGTWHDTSYGGASWGPAIEQPAATFNTIGTYDAVSGYYDSEVILPGWLNNGKNPQFSENRSILSSLSALGALTVGSWYTLAFGRRVGIISMNGFNAVVAEIGGVPNPSGWTAVAAFVEGDPVSMVAPSKFLNLENNINMLKARVDNYPHTLYERSNQESTNDAGQPTGPNYTTEAHFFRRGDTVIWRGTGVSFSYSDKRIPTNTQPNHKAVLLGDSPGGGTGDATLDLNSVVDLPREGDYFFGGGILYAFESI